jgi:hypothetical protein
LSLAIQNMERADISWCQFSLDLEPLLPLMGENFRYTKSPTSNDRCLLCLSA